MVDLTSALTSFEAWRANRKNSKQKIPDELWAMACELSHEHGITRVAKALRINRSELGRRLSSSAGRGKTSHYASPSIRVTPLIVHNDRPAPTKIERGVSVVAELVSASGLRVKLFEGISGELAKALVSQALEAK